MKPAAEQLPWPLDEPGHLAALLREQGAAPAEIDAWAPVAQRLAEWPERTITAADTRHLLAVLAPLLPARSAVRQAVRAHFARRRGSLAWLLDTARVQCSILRPTFWLASAAVMLLGVYLELASWNHDSALFLRALGPLLAYLGISAAFRGVGLRAVECEIACPPSPVQLALARVAVVLGYDVALGLCLSMVGWLRAMHGGASFLAVTLHWSMPLLLVAGLALVLSLRLPAALAAALAYVCWLGVLLLYYSIFYAVAQAGAATIPTVPIGAEIALGLAGLALLTIGTLRFPTSVPRLLPTV